MPKNTIFVGERGVETFLKALNPGILNQIKDALYDPRQTEEELQYQASKEQEWRSMSYLDYLERARCEAQKRLEFQQNFCCRCIRNHFICNKEGTLTECPLFCENTLRDDEDDNVRRDPINRFPRMQAEPMPL